jgi:hypothetical protein
LVGVLRAPRRNIFKASPGIVDQQQVNALTP